MKFKVLPTWGRYCQFDLFCLRYMFCLGNNFINFKKKNRHIYYHTWGHHYNIFGTANATPRVSYLEGKKSLKGCILGKAKLIISFA